MNSGWENRESISNMVNILQQKITFCYISVIVKTQTMTTRWLWLSALCLQLFEFYKSGLFFCFCGRILVRRTKRGTSR